MSSQEEARRKDWVRAELEYSLQALAMPAEVQFQLYPQGVCYACELTTDFQNFSEGYITDNEGILTKEQKSALSKMQEHLTKLAHTAEYQCWNEEPIRTGVAWQQARDLAKQCLIAFAWEIKAPPMRGAMIKNPS